MIEKILLNKMNQVVEQKQRLQKSQTNKDLYKMIMLGLCVITLLTMLMPYKSVEASSKKTYTITTKTAPLNKKYSKLDTYNNKTKHYYVLRSYLEDLETRGGGTLTLSKGTYTVTNTLYIPSNVTIRLKSGAVIKKSDNTGTSKLVATKSLFQMVAPSKTTKANSSVKYAGVKNITIKGSGTASIDMNYVKDTTGIVIGHGSNIKIEGIHFKNMNDGSFIKISAVSKLNILNNTFSNYKVSATRAREAINIETADSETLGFTYPWSKADKTVSSGITIKGNTFNNLERAIGSMKYSHKKYQKKIQITDNTFTKISNSSIRVLNWENTIITKNTFDNNSNKEGNAKVILVSGALNPTISGNTFKNSDRPIQIMPAKNNNNGETYAITYNTISDENRVDMLDNVLVDMKEHYIRYNTIYNDFVNGTEKWDILDLSEKDFVLSPTSETYNNNFVNYSTYNKDTKLYYVLRSYLEQLEATKGGTLTLSKGTYGLSNTLYVPSNVTIILEDGVKIQKLELTGANSIGESKSVFQLAAPSKSKEVGAYSGHNGESNIHFIGKGSGTIDLSFVEDSLGIVIGHNRNVSIKGITFMNMRSGHYLEVDAAKDVVIEENKFMNSKPSKGGIKEGINIDIPDKETQGFNVIWTSHDKTPNNNILIKNNEFSGLERAIGTHKYTEGKYHENIQIIDNTIKNMSSDAIRVLNWSNPVIKGNTIDTVTGEGDRAILMSGVKNPMVTENVFKNLARPIQIMPWKNSDTGSIYAPTYNEVSQENIQTMLKNTLINVGESFIRINHVLDVYDRETNKLQYSSEYIK